MEPQLRYKPFERLVREVKADCNPDLKMQRAAIMALREASEAYLVQRFQETNLVAVESKPPCVTLMQRHMKMVEKLKRHRAEDGTC